ncbi:annexin A7-like isoform X2 [Ciona intestinalis]
MKGLGTNEKTLIEIIANRSNKQRQAIRESYKQAFGRDLMKDIKSEIGGNFCDLAIALMEPSALFDAKCLYGAIKGVGTTETTLVEILASRTNQQIKEIREVYKKEHKHELEKDITGDTSGDFKKLLVSLNNGARDGSPPNEEHAKIDAESLYKAGEKKMGTDEATFNRILCTRSFGQLREIFRQYKKISKKDIIKAIESEFSGDIEMALKMVVRMAECPPSFFAKRLHDSMKGAGTKDDALIRLVVTRSEVDMVEIKERFQAMYKSSLEKFIKGDTSGDYEKLLLAVIS